MPNDDAHSSVINWWEKLAVLSFQFKYAVHYNFCLLSLKCTDNDAIKNADIHSLLLQQQ